MSMSIVVATCLDKIKDETENKQFSYNRVNNGKSFANMYNQLKDVSFSEVDSYIKENNGYEIKVWDDYGIIHYDPATVRDTKGRKQKLRHSLNPDGSYYKTETTNLEDIKTKTNVRGIFIITEDNKLYYYDDAVFGLVEDFFQVK